MNWGSLVQLALQVLPLFLPQAQNNPLIASAAGAIASYDHDTVRWLQRGLNTVLGVTPPLKVDGLWGPKTRAAVELAEQHFGLPPSGLLGRGLILALEAATKAVPKT